MAYNIIVSARAQKEIESAIDYYALYSTHAPQNFVAALKETYYLLGRTHSPEYVTKISGRLKSGNFRICLLYN